jgi:hypothetical protein
MICKNAKTCPSAGWCSHARRHKRGEGCGISHRLSKMCHCVPHKKARRK